MSEFAWLVNLLGRQNFWLATPGNVKKRPWHQFHLFRINLQGQPRNEQRLKTFRWTATFMSANHHHFGVQHTQWHPQNAVINFRQPNYPSQTGWPWSSHFQCVEEHTVHCRHYTTWCVHSVAHTYPTSLVYKWLTNGLFLSKLESTASAIGSIQRDNLQGYLSDVFQGQCCMTMAALGR